ncbi:hypothetical protein CONCODRAFT_9503 [Conidiobolus coronatus NRRL 28638]|uniref:Xylanolytic transcriptional activator regulatory domain-containing protein n=1 Tax=Conidiobolus coronatus (strain ATCC 28846 / CBS 209.66 / NRRL 28638) TaxID=796925 RepID=A0A137P077_CONC2|nr:hypothetical protein CONCODRAFT_9503 [Conidiobolus coronatus NRRL 28638]|eukprot:KXN68274.1 hypothetical protein CONCODRAFT_9503 [Conidiobolus coronatus NRRL 28638]
MFNNIEFKTCIKCKVALAKLSDDYCNSCKYKLSSTKSLSTIKYRISTTRFDNKSIKSFQDKYPDSESGKLVNINNIKIQRNLTFIDSINTQKTGCLSFCLKFNNLEDLSSYILKSKQVNFVHLLLVGAKKLQSVPKIRNLIESQGELSSYKIFYPKPFTSPYTSPLQLLTKSSFWENLLNAYFKNFYDRIPVLSIAHFDPKTASQHLLAAIYYAGYKSQPDQPEELTSYMESKAKENLKLLIRQCSLSAIQALLVYFLVYFREGNISLHYTCRAHATRIGYALGIHLDNKIFSELEKYTRRLVIISLRSINIVGSSSHNLSASFLTEFGSLNTKPTELEWQTLSKSSVIYYEDENERVFRGMSYTHYINFIEKLKYSIHCSLYSTVKDSRYKFEWNKTRKDVTRVYQKYIRIFQSLSSTHPNYSQIASKYEVQVCLYYHDTMVDMYSKLVSKFEDLNSSDIDDALCHLNWMLKYILSNNQSAATMQIHLIILGYQYICFYKLCNTSTKQTIQSKLAQIIQALSIYYTPSNALSFIILKNGYKSIINDNI